MMGKFTPTLLMEGPADFTILTVEKSKSRERGTPMLVVDLFVTDANQKCGSIRVWAVETPPWNLNAMMASVGRSDLKDLIVDSIRPDDLLGLEGKCILKTDTEYKPEEPRSKICKFLPADEQTQKASWGEIPEEGGVAQTFKADFDEDDIPF